MSSRWFARAALALLAAMIGAGCGTRFNGSKTIGAEGGSITLIDGSGVTIPPGALASPITITAQEAPGALAPSGAIVVGTPLTVTPADPQLSIPATVTLAFDPSALPAGTIESQIVILSAPAGSDRFVPLLTLMGDATHVFAQTGQFATFAAAILQPELSDGGDDAGSRDAGSPDAGLDAGPGNPLPHIAYAASAFACTRDAPCTVDAPLNDGGPIDSLSIAPALPAGLAFASDGSISGTATALAPVASFTVTAANDAGADPVAFTLTVVDGALLSLSYPSSTLTCTIGTRCSSGVPSLEGGPYATFALASGSLPAGLSLDPSSGEISGTASSASSQRFEIIASNSAGSTAASLLVVVNNG